MLHTLFIILTIAKFGAVINKLFFSFDILCFFASSHYIYEFSAANLNINLLAFQVFYLNYINIFIFSPLEPYLLLHLLERDNSSNLLALHIILVLYLD